MEEKTQDIVLNIDGAEELLQKTEEIFQDRDKKIVFVENGFQVYSEGLPYSFQVSCHEEIGWNVFLIALNGTIEDDEETDGLYHQLEDAVDTVNQTYYMEDFEKEHIPYHFFQLKSLTEDKIKNVEEVGSVKDTGKYVLRISFHKVKDLTLELGYSKIFNKWYYEFHHPQTKDVKDEILQNHHIRSYLKELDGIINHYNHVMYGKGF